MCVTSNLQKHIRNLTNDGELVARFLVDTVEGKTPGVKPCHQVEAMKYLVRFGLSEQEKSHFWGLIPTPEEVAEKKATEEPAPEPKERPVTHLDILNYDVAHLIRHETADGHTIAEFLAHVMTGRDKPFTPRKLRIRQADRMAAAREILRRGHGHFGRRRRLVVDADDDTNGYDILHTDLAKRMREYGDYGAEAVRFLLDVMNDANPDEPYSWHHRTSAAQELVRRGWDTNYDRITSEMLQAYWRDQQSTRLSVGQKKHLAGLHTFLDEYDQYDNTDYEAVARERREAEDLEEANAFKSRLKHAGGSPTEERDIGFNTPSPSKVEGRDGGDTPAQTIAPSPAIKCSPGPSAPDMPDDRPAADPEAVNEDDTREYGPNDPDPDVDYYVEPLTPEDEAAFDHQMRIETGGYPDGEVPDEPPPPPPGARAAYEAQLRRIREAAARDGVPVRPNPIAGTFARAAIRSP